MPKRQTKKYSRPRKIFDISLMKEENGLIKKYGLKSRREVWRADFAIETIRKIAKRLITASEKDKETFLEKQRKKGFAVTNIAEVLALNKEDLLKRRLQSILVTKKLAETHKQARQLITHKHVILEGHKIDSPSHLTTVDEENSLELTLAIPAKKIISDEDKRLLEKLNHTKEKVEEAQ
jgi:small subunit ribosomal protein S4